MKRIKIIKLDVAEWSFFLPTRYIRVAIEPKAKVGRNAKAKGCLVRQDCE